MNPYSAKPLSGVSLRAYRQQHGGLSQLLPQVLEAFPKADAEASVCCSAL